MLAADEFTIRLGKEDPVFLRPTLKAALRLERAFGGFDKLLEAIADENVSAMATVIRESSTTSTEVPRILEDLAHMPLHIGIDVLKEPLISFVLRLAGHGDEIAAPVDPNAKRIIFAEHHAKLFQVATGWLGWSPEMAYSSTASEIEEAFKGRVDMLKAIFGSGEGAANDADKPAPSAEEFNSKLMAFARAMGTRVVELEPVS